MRVGVGMSWRSDSPGAVGRSLGTPHPYSSWPPSTLMYLAGSAWVALAISVCGAQGGHTSNSQQAQTSGKGWRGRGFSRFAPPDSAGAFDLQPHLVSWHRKLTKASWLLLHGSHLSLTGKDGETEAQGRTVKGTHLEGAPLGPTLVWLQTFCAE